MKRPISYIVKEYEGAFSERLLQKMCKEGIIKSYQPTGRKGKYLIDVEAFEKWIESHPVKTDEDYETLVANEFLKSSNKKRR